jgi:hypothetical protein
MSPQASCSMRWSVLMASGSKTVDTARVQGPRKPCRAGGAPPRLRRRRNGRAIPCCTAAHRL